MCDRLCLNHPSFSSPIYADYNGFLFFYSTYTLQILQVPEHNCSEIFHFEKSAIFRTLQLLRTTLRKSCGHTNARCECSAGSVWDLRSEITRDYSTKPSSRVTTRRDEENQAFLTMDCNCLQSLFISPNFLTINGSSGAALGDTIRSRHFVLAAQDSQYIVDYTHTDI